MSNPASIRIAPVGLTGRPGEPAGSGSDLLETIAEVSLKGADLVTLPQLSFSPYFPVRRDREALELGERSPSKRMAAARQAAGKAWLAASAYECVGEGVFHVRGELGREAEGTVLAQRQRVIDAKPGRYEQMFISPGFEEPAAAELPWGRTGLLVGSDARDPGAWGSLASLGVRLVLVSVSEEVDGWQGIRRIAAGFGSIHGFAVAAVNRDPAPDEPDFAGGSFFCDSQGGEILPDGDGVATLPIPDPRSENA